MAGGYPGWVVADLTGAAVQDRELVNLDTAILVQERVSPLASAAAVSRSSAVISVHPLSVVSAP